MKTLTSLILSLFACTLLVGQYQDARSIMQNYQDANEINDLTSKISYKNISKKGREQHRELTQYISKQKEGTDKYKLLLKFTAPRDIAGTSTLTIQHPDKNDDQWLYLPAIKATKKISASKKADRFMGTEMTYEDLSNYLSEPMDQWHYDGGQLSELDGHNCYLIISTPKLDTKTQYTKKEIWIDQQTNQIKQIKFFDKKNDLLKVLSAEDIQPITNTGQYRAHKVTIQNIKTGNRTEVLYKDFTIDGGISDRYFSKSYLENN